MINTVSLNRNALFRRAYSKGTSYANRYLAAYILKNKLKTNRLGITVSKKIGCAVVRNRVRRKIKEAYRLGEFKVKTGYDIVIVARTAAADADFFSLQSAFWHLMGRLDLKTSGDENEKSSNISD